MHKQKMSNTERIRLLLKGLCADKRNVVYLMSSRTREHLDGEFGDLNVGLSAENGIYIKHMRVSRKARKNGDGEWVNLMGETDLSWREKVLEVSTFHLEQFLNLVFLSADFRVLHRVSGFLPFC